MDCVVVQFKEENRETTGYYYAMHRNKLTIRLNCAVMGSRGLILRTVIAQCTVLGGSDYKLCSSKR